MHAALNAFVPADWAFSRIERGGDAIGYERIRLSASARVKSEENRDLTERARRANREGLTLGVPRTGKGAYRDDNDPLRLFDEPSTVQGFSGMGRIKLLATVTLRATPDQGLAHD